MELLEVTGTETNFSLDCGDTKLRASGYLNGLSSEFGCCCFLIRKKFKHPIWIGKMHHFQNGLLPEYGFPKILTKRTFSSQF